MSIHSVNEADFSEVLSTLEPYTSWHPEILACKEDNPQLKYANAGKVVTDSFSSQMVNFLAHHQGQGFNREQLVQVAKVLVPNKPPSRDIIQTVNKMNQKGLAQDHTGPASSRIYGIESVRYDPRYLAHRWGKDGDAEDVFKFSEPVNRDFFASLSAETKYERGHKDPRLPLTADNMVAQPASVNRAFRDNYMFDDHGLPTAVMPKKLIAQIKNGIYSTEEIEQIQEALKSYLREQKPSNDVEKDGESKGGMYGGSYGVPIEVGTLNLETGTKEKSKMAGGFDQLKKITKILTSRKIPSLRRMS